MSNAKCHTRPYVAVRVVATARPAAWQRGSAAALEINENEGHSTPRSARPSGLRSVPGMQRVWATELHAGHRSEEHTSELQSRVDLVCRLLLEKKKKRKTKTSIEARE